MQGLADAARSRQRADWLVGINGTRAMTAFNSATAASSLTTVGRVQTPTLALVVEREEQIRKFVSRDYWEIHASFRPGRRIPGQMVRPQWKKGDDAEKPPTACGRSRGPGDCRRRARQAATVTGESKPTTQASPLLFDLTSLQREANASSAFGQDHAGPGPKPVRAHKALTYPRTDSRHLPGTTCRWCQTFEMLADSGMRHLAPHAATALNNQLHQAQQAHLRQQQGQRPLRHHPHHAGAQRPERPEQSSMTWWCAASWRCSSRAPNTW